MNLKKMIILGGVGLASGAIGILIPTMMSGSHAPATATSEKDAGHGHGTDADQAKAGHDDKAKSGHDDKAGHDAPKADAHGGDAHGGHGGKEEEKVPKEGIFYVPFGRMVINLNEPTLLRFLSIDIQIQSDYKFKKELDDALKTRKPILTTWLTTHLADKTIEDLRGKVGVNRLRREIQDNFNSLLFKDGHERVQDIMFDEIHIQ